MATMKKSTRSPPRSKHKEPPARPSRKPKGKPCVTSVSYGTTAGCPAHHGAGAREYHAVPCGTAFKPGQFGRMFPELPMLSVPDEMLEVLANAMVDVDGNPADDNATIPAGFTYLGQFIDHDVTFDTTTMPEVQIDPQSIFNFRTPKLEMDSVYGTGPSTQPYLYEDGVRMRVGATQTGQGDPSIPAGMPNDLLRLNGIAVIGDPRNDENLAVAQIHLAFIKFHNKVVDSLTGGGLAGNALFTEARRLVTWHYQRMIIDDYLDRLCAPDVLDDVITNGPRFFKFEGEPFMPVEFSVAAYRFGHSQVRNAYNFNRVFRSGGVTPATLDLLFTFSHLSGPRTPETIPVPSDWIADWRRLFEVGGGVSPDATRKIDPLLATSLHNLPGNGGSLPFRNMQRGVRMGLPSGQAVAEAVSATPLTPAELSQGPDGSAAVLGGMHINSPLWYYILKEAQVQQNGDRLGEVGSRIVAEVIIGMMDGDPLSFRRQNPAFEPTLFKSGESPVRAGKYTMVDLLRFTDDINPIG